MFNSPHGKRVLTQWLGEDYCTISYVLNGRCCDTAYNEGRRSVYHQLLESLEHAEHQHREGTGEEAEEDGDLRIS